MKPLTRKERIEVLLDHWEDFYAIASRDQTSASGGGIYLINGMSQHPSVIELARALESLRAFAPSKYAHLIGYYSSPYRNVTQRKRIRGKNGKFGWDEERVRQRVKPAWVDMGKVRDAVSLVAQEAPHGSCRPWCFDGDPFIPAPLLESVQGPLVAA